MTQRRIDTGVLGATGIVGQQFVRILAGHPWFDLKWIGASDRSAGRRYAAAASWKLDGEVPEPAASLTVEDCKPGNAPKLLFSAMDASVATDIERAFAEAGHIVVSNSRNHRMEPDVPLLVPEVNADHLGALPLQQRRRGWRGMIATNPNCSIVVLSLALGALRQFDLKCALVTTMQAISGAGYPGVPSFDINANVIPYIDGEEEKMESETRKILGDFAGGQFLPHSIRVSAHCNRVPVNDGHTETISVEFGVRPTEVDLLEAFASYRGEPQHRNLPSAPSHPVVYLPEPDRPQPRRDAGRQNGMAVTLGRLRPCPVLDYKFVALGHNTVRGAAGAAILNAELMHSEGLLG
jgi:aspartate-semialdehyde dehydrogenase